MSELTKRETRLKSYEERMEQILIEISSETDEDGFAIAVNITPILNEFSEVMNQLRGPHKPMLSPNKKE